MVRFPGKPPQGFNAAVSLTLNNMLKISRLDASYSPLKQLADQYAEHPRHINRLQDLCVDPGFQGQLVWLDGIKEDNWPAWRDFLITYADISRSQKLFGRSLFLVLLAGYPPLDAPPADVGLATQDWDGILDDLDMLLFATERIRMREESSLLCSLLASMIARVAVWDFETAEALGAQSNDTILDPDDLLREVAAEKGWQASTPLDWQLGTASRSGVAHPARAILDDPPDDLKRRLWSAQLSVFLPWIEARRHDTVAEHYFDVKRQMRIKGTEQEDPFGLELGTLVNLFGRRGANRRARHIFVRLREVRNELAHRRHVSQSTLVDLMELMPP